VGYHGGKQIPHKDIVQHAFVLEPLAEIAPTLQHPISTISYEKLWKSFNKTDAKQKRVKPPWLIGKWFFDTAATFNTR